MRDRSYDVVGVDTTGDGSADSFLELVALDLGRPIHLVARPLLASFAVERSMPLVDLMPLLHDRAYVFVLDGDRVRHIVTRADLAKPAVGISVLALLLQLEQVLLPRAIDRLGSEWFETLPDAVRTKARQTQERKRGRRVELGLERCLYFDDAMALVASAPGLVRELGTTETKFNGMRGKMAGLRNDLAHGGSMLDRLKPTDALDTVAEVRRLVDAALHLIPRE